jgi:hypothetical protein
MQAGKKRQAGRQARRKEQSQTCREGNEAKQRKPRQGRQKECSGQVVRHTKAYRQTGN